MDLSVVPLVAVGLVLSDKNPKACKHVVHEEEDAAAYYQTLCASVDFQGLREVRLQVLFILHDFEYFNEPH